MIGPRVTYRTRAVLTELLAASPEGTWGLAICRATKLRAGTVYPILERLRDAGWVVHQPETGPHPGRPARGYYALTEAGREKARQTVDAPATRLPVVGRTRPRGIA